jgi:Zn-dependent peptidase ImmA (M78 family)/DNA-binding XRE family transcriptional regulator
MEFVGSELRLARVFNAYSLEEVAERVGKTRQYLHKCETGQAIPSPELISDLAEHLHVQPEFFFSQARARTVEDQFHFRKLFTTKAGIKQVAMARGEMVARLVATFEAHLKLPAVSIPDFGSARTAEEIENAADNCRREWGLGMGPIDDMNRLAEHVGVFVTTFKSISKEIDALSVATSRPIIVRNDAKESPCRQRFDIGHELGHLSLHSGVVTGDRETESQANRFASSLLVPRSMMLKLFPKPKGTRLDWKAISDFKLDWKVSKAASLYRARQLGIITDEQYKSGVITLNRTGEAQQEREDYLIRREQPEMVQTSFDVLLQRKGIDAPHLSLELNVTTKFLEDLVGLTLMPKLRPKLRVV